MLIILSSILALISLFFASFNHDKLAAATINPNTISKQPRKKIQSDNVYFEEPDLTEEEEAFLEDIYNHPEIAALYIEVCDKFLNFLNKHLPRNDEQ